MACICFHVLYTQFNYSDRQLNREFSQCLSQCTLHRESSLLRMLHWHCSPLCQNVGNEFEFGALKWQVFFIFPIKIDFISPLVCIYPYVYACLRMLNSIAIDITISISQEKCKTHFDLSAIVHVSVIFMLWQCHGTAPIQILIRIVQRFKWDVCDNLYSLTKFSILLIPLLCCIAQCSGLDITSGTGVHLSIKYIFELDLIASTYPDIQMQIVLKAILYFKIIFRFCHNNGKTCLVNNRAYYGAYITCFDDFAF